MTKTAQWIFWLTTGIFLSLGVFLWQEHPDSFLASTVRDIIDYGAHGDPAVRSYLRDPEAPLIAGYTAEEKVDRALLTLINIILYVCGTASAIMIIVGGIRYIISFGNDDAMTNAKKTILWACGGLVVTYLAWAIVLNVVRIGSIEERLDYSENPAGGVCSPNVVMLCGDTCCGCFGPSDCDDGLQCGGPMDVVVFDGINELEDNIRVCQPGPV